MEEHTRSVRGGSTAPVERIVLVEDHGLLANTLATALGFAGHNVAVADGTAIDELLYTVGPEADDTLVLLDLDLGAAGDATPLVPRLTERGATVVMVTGVEDPIRLARCIAAGASGIVSKRAAYDELLDAVEQVAAGRSLLSKHERDEHLAVLRSYEQDERERLADFEALTPREADVLGMLMAGRTVQEIAAEAVVSVATVRTQVRAVLRKLDVPSQVAAIGRARAAGWIPPQERSRD
jgi:two-component system nitrate/nitrite response regulator NarL